MDDSINRQAAIYALWKSPMFTSYSVLKILSDRLNELPTAQPEIIRCKDCMYNNDCEIQYRAQSGDEFFCGCAERKNNDKS